MRKIFETIADAIAAWQILINLNPSGTEHPEEWIDSARDVFYDKLSAIDPDEAWFEILSDFGFDELLINELTAVRDSFEQI